jgi:predicted transposase YdaD
MSKPFDATLKQLLAEFAPNWVSWLAPQFGLPSNVRVEPLDADLSTVQLAADKVFRLCPPAEGLLHLEAQSSWGGELADRLLTYNSLLHDRYGGPVYSLALLLRRDANSPNLSGTLIRTYPDGQEYHRFRYSVVRVWQLELASLLEAGPGLYPLALLTDEAEPQLGELVNQLDVQMRADKLTEQTRLLVHTSGFLLMGMRYTVDVIQGAFLGVRTMTESTSYQFILAQGRDEGIKLGRQEGRQEGQVEASQVSLIQVLEERFGNLPNDLIQTIRGLTDLETLRVTMRQALRAATLSDFQHMSL